MNDKHGQEPDNKPDFEEDDDLLEEASSDDEELFDDETDDEAVVKDAAPVLKFNDPNFDVENRQQVKGQHKDTDQSSSLSSHSSESLSSSSRSSKSSGSFSSSDSSSSSVPASSSSSESSHSLSSSNSSGKSSSSSKEFVKIKRMHGRYMAGQESDVPKDERIEDSSRIPKDVQVGYIKNIARDMANLELVLLVVRVGKYDVNLLVNSRTDIFVGRHRGDVDDLNISQTIQYEWEGRNLHATNIKIMAGVWEGKVKSQDSRPDVHIIEGEIDSAISKKKS